MKRVLMVATLALLALLLILQPVLAAMSSSAYLVDWLLLTGSGGPPMVSTFYQAESTLGQTVSGFSAGSLYTFQGGYWAFVGLPYALFLPAVRK